MYSELLPKIKFTGQEYWWTKHIVYVADTVRPDNWRCYNVACSDEAKDYQEFKNECTSLRF
jgi:hypothetical protein